MCVFLEIKTMRRENWKRILKRAYVYTPFQRDGLAGVAGLIHLERVSEPFVRSVLGKEIVLASDGYYWLQIAPFSEHWWLTVMFDEQHRIVQYYFDITGENVINEDGGSFFYDLYLDVVHVPGTGTVLLDEDELCLALEEGKVDAAACEVARTTADEIMSGLKANEKRLEEFCHGLMEMLCAAMR